MGKKILELSLLHMRTIIILQTQFVFVKHVVPHHIKEVV